MTARATTPIEVPLERAILELDGAIAMVLELAQSVKAGVLEQGADAHRDDLPCCELAIGLCARVARLVDEMRGRRTT